jgi:hypothetical protein
VNKPIIITVIDTEDQLALIPWDNIAYITVVGGTTRIYLQHVAGASKILWYVLTHESVQSLKDLLAGMMP